MGIFSYSWGTGLPMGGQKVLHFLDGKIFIQCFFKFSQHQPFRGTEEGFVFLEPREKDP
jgi:hypothetical protein